MVRTNYKARQMAGILDIYLYDDIEPDGYNWWTDEKEESETSAAHIQKILSEAGNVTQINLYINSYGGDVKEGMGIYSQLKRHTANKTAYIDGFACSIASVIAMACNNIVMGINGLICGIYKVKANKLDTIMYTLRFGERVTGIKRFYMAYAADVKINKVIHVPLKPDIQLGDRVVIGEIQYSIEQVQQLYDTNPTVSVLTLMKIGKAAVI